MLRYLIPFLLVGSSLTLQADSVVRSGSFEVFTTAGDREAKDIMNFAEQLRFTLGSQLGNPDLKTIWPVRILVVKSGKNARPASPDCQLARDAFVCSVSTLVPEFSVSLTRIVLESWNGYLPPTLYRGLLQVYSTIQIEGTKITLGAVPPQKDRDWARAHMLCVDPEYSGKLRVLLGNLSKGVEAEVAYRNAFGQSPDNLEKAVDNYLQSGSYGTLNAASRPLNAQRQLMAKEAIPEDIRVLQADLLLAANQTRPAGAAYQALLQSNPQLASAHEGLGLLAVRTNQAEEARRELASATSAAGLIAYAKLLPDSDSEGKRTALAKAAAANPRLAEPHLLLARLETHPAQKLSELKKAIAAQPGTPELWIELAQLQDSINQFTEAAKSWSAAERATGDPEARERVRQSRMAGEAKRLEADLAAKAEARRQTEAEMEAFRNQALLKIREAEARANSGRVQLDPGQLDRYKEEPDTKKLTGTLTRVNCLGDKAELVITRGARQTSTVLVPDPTKVAIAGGGDRAFTCGPQKPARRVTVEYSPRTNLGPGLAGEAVNIEFNK